MWTIAAVNKKFNGPLGSYNGLTDVHLAHYFSRPSRRSHLKAAKLITEDGFIVPEKNVKGELYLDEKKKKVYDILARSILQNAIHKEGSWNKKLCNYLEDISKMAAVDKARRSFKKKSSKVASELFCEQLTSNYSSEGGGTRSSSNWAKSHHKIFNSSHSAPVTCFSLTSNGHHKVANLKRCLSAKQHSPYIVPLLLCGSYKDQDQSIVNYEKSLASKQKKTKRKSYDTSNIHLKTPEKKTSMGRKNISIPQSLKFSECKVTLLYHGHLHLVNCQKSLSQNILIKQQHCGGTPVIIFKGKILANEMLSFLSLDHEGFFFSIIVFLNGIRELKLSSCCVFRYPIGRRLGGSNGAFSVKNIEGGKPCLKCQYQEFESKNVKDFTKASEYIVHNSISKENSAISLNENKADDKVSDEVSEAEDDIQNALIINDDESQKGAPVAKHVDDDIEEVLEDIHNETKIDSSSEEQIIDDTNASSIEDEIKDHEESNHSASPDISEISDIYIDPKKYHEITIDSSSEDERENQHLVTVSIHGSPVKS